MLALQNVSCGYHNGPVVQQVSFQLEAGQWLMLVGPNGAGKTTLLRAITGVLPHTGSILLDSKPIRQYPARLLAQRVGVLAQQQHMPYAFTVNEVVSMGRYAHRKGAFAAQDPQGQAAIQEALAITGLSPLASKSVLSLSGGELQRVALARVLAQQPSLLLLDEPMNHLDLHHQQQLFSMLCHWLKSPGRALLSVMHDLSVAKKYGTHALLFREGRSIAQGPIDTALRKEALQQAYDMDVPSWMRGLLGQWT